MATMTSGSRGPTRSMVARRGAPSLWRVWLPTLYWLLLASAVQAAGGLPALKSGQFDGLMLAIDSAGHLTGYYREDQDSDPPKHCRFFLAGRIQGSTAAITTWSSVTLAGQLATAPTGVRLTITRGKEHAGCGLVLPPEISSGMLLERLRPENWTELRTVQAGRAYFHKAADASTRLRSYVVVGNIVSVLAARSDWIKVDYMAAANKRVRGWLRLSDTQAFDKM